MDAQKNIRNILLYVEYQKQLKSYNSLSLIKRIFTPKPKRVNVDPKSECRNYLSVLNRKYATCQTFEDGSWCVIRFYHNRDKRNEFMPIAEIKVYDDGCYFIEKWLINHYGEKEKCSIYPYSECGLWGRKSDKRYLVLYRQFDIACDEIIKWMS